MKKDSAGRGLHKGVDLCDTRRTRPVLPDLNRLSRLKGLKKQEEAEQIGLKIAETGD